MQMTTERRYTISEARLPRDLPAIHGIRRQVFIEEQGIPAQLEWDGRDDICRHVLASNQRRIPIGTGRLDPEGRIGRMAVLQPWRMHGIGTVLLDALLTQARVLGHREVVVHAQCSVAGFYRKAGFREKGRHFREAGIEHLKMVKTLVSGNNERNR
jgi:predicted GNAT family N-acyltransferase